jgi:asparagine synthase (glutamine-hydrolysing)
MDGRIDNRDELVKELCLSDRPIDEIGDSEFILAAYLKWGDECPKHLLGDYAFAIWDKQKEQLFCARDYIGVKQFYYYMDDEKFIFSNEVKVLLVCKEIEFAYDENTIAKYLRPDYIVEHDCTFYENIKKLLPARTMSIRKNDAKEYIYWRLEDSPKIRYENIDEYIHSARKLLAEAVYCRIRSAYPIASHLSGGLDSSSIAVLASRKLAESGQNLTGYNWIPVLDSFESSEYYEWHNSKKIASLENIDHIACDLTAEEVFEIYKNLNIFLGDTLHFWYEIPMQKEARSKNIRTILSGTGGDQFISHFGLSNKKKPSLFKKIAAIHHSMASESSSLAELLSKHVKRFTISAIKRIIPDRIFCIYSGNHCSYVVPKFIRSIIATKMKKLQANVYREKNLGIRDEMIIDYLDGSIQARFESWGLSGKQNKIEYRYPLLDRRLVEFAFGIPEEIFHYNGEARFLFRQMIQNLLPEKIVYSDTKYEPKRVRHYIEIIQKAQKLWKNGVYFENKCKYFKTDELIREIDLCPHNNYDKIATIASAILIFESLRREKNEKILE